MLHTALWKPATLQNISTGSALRLPLPVEQILRQRTFVKIRPVYPLKSRQFVRPSVHQSVRYLNYSEKYQRRPEQSGK
jgi:hypothetical protein